MLVDGYGKLLDHMAELRMGLMNGNWRIWVVSVEYQQRRMLTHKAFLLDLVNLSTLPALCHVK